MKQCKTIACKHYVAGDLEDYCLVCKGGSASNDTGPRMALQTSSGRDNDYWVADITHPKRLESYQAECEDLIEHFQMTFQEGEAFKALWRKGQLRIGNGKPGDTHLRNAEKVGHFGGRMEVMEQRAMECTH